MHPEDITSVLIGDDGYNYDVLAAHGAALWSPGECHVVGLFIDGTAAQGIHFVCSSNPLDKAAKMGYGHIDLAWNNYATLEQYGIPIETFFNADGTPRLGIENIRPRKNARLHTGDGPVAYVGNTGDHEMPYHVHVNVWTIVDNSFRDLRPEEFIRCNP